jgi:nicotinate-nucleotide adenylyltransferase
LGSGRGVRIGVFGGQFDPPHVGHLIVCQEARYRLALDRLLVVPAGTPAHRAPPETPAELRLRLAEAAFAGEPRTEVSRIELERPGPSYTVDTLEALAGEGELYLILGADQYATFERWREPDRIRRLARSRRDPARRCRTATRSCSRRRSSTSPPASCGDGSRPANRCAT